MIPAGRRSKVNVTEHARVCCGSGMIYSKSRSSYEFLEFRIRILPMFFKHIWKLSKWRIYQIIWYLISISNDSPIFIFNFFICAFIFCWIRNKNSGSGSTTLHSKVCTRYWSFSLRWPELWIRIHFLRIRIQQFFSMRIQLLIKSGSGQKNFCKK